MSVPDVTVVIAAYNAARTLPALLGACREQEFNGEVEILVVDDGSTDDTAGVAKNGGARVVSQENRGPAAARNRGWREARAPVVLFTDADCIPKEDWAQKLFDGIDDTHPVACGSYGIANPGTLLPETIHAEILWRHARLGDEVEFAGSYNFGARRAVLEEVGGFDESYPAPSGEDNDLSYRIRDTGHTIRFVRDALVAHHHPTSLGRYLNEQARHGLWRVILYAQHPGRMKGDGYSGPFDFIAPPLAVLSIAALPLGLISPVLWIGAPLCFALVIAIHDVMALQVSRHSRSTAPLALAGIGTLRAYARGWGMLRGVLAVLRGKHK